eukprot:jgi/Ulvmu1/7201/UM034_0110.1
MGRSNPSQHAKAVQAIQNARPQIHKIYHDNRPASVRNRLEKMDDLLAKTQDQLDISNNAMKAAVRSVGLNLRNGHFYGGPIELANSLQSKTRRVKIKIVQAQPCLKHVKYCLVRVL